MSNNTSPALQVALAYHDAWKNLDHATAMKVVADNVVSETPFGPIEGGAALHKSESEFAGMLKGATMVASDSMMNFGVSTPSLPQVIFSFGTAPE